MLDTLIESGVRGPHRIGGGSFSLFAHALLIGGAVAATTQSKLTDEDLPEPQVVEITIAPRHVEVSRTAPSAASSISPIPRIVPDLPILQLPNLIPDAIPNPTFDPSPVDEHTVFGRRGSTVLGAGAGGDSTAGSGSPGSPWMGSELLTHMLGKPTPPRYPSLLQRAGIEGEVVTKFVIDTTGRIDLSSVEIVRATHDLFTASVREVLPKLRFQPSMIGDRKVKAAAILPFVFQIRK